jgi:hypothetical protein
LRRYELGWSGVVTRRIGSYATASEVDYDRTGIHKIIGDGGLSVIMNDSSRLILGGGTIAMDAFNAIAHSVTGPFFSGELVLTPAYRSRIDVRYAQYRFSDGVRRDRSDLEGLQQVTSNPYAKIRFGWRSNLMWHDRGTDDFYSPASFMAHMMVAQSYGKIARSLDYFAEVSGGWQSETATPLQHPLQISGRLVWNPRENVRILLELGRTTSSLERVIPDRNSYHRRFASIGLNYMF